MITLKFLSKLYKAFPNAILTDPFMNASYIFDKKGNMMGHYDYSETKIYLNDSYEFLKEAKYSLDRNDIEYELKHYKESEILYGNMK